MDILKEEDTMDIVKEEEESSCSSSGIDRAIHESSTTTSSMQSLTEDEALDDTWKTSKPGSSKGIHFISKYTHCRLFDLIFNIFGFVADLSDDNYTSNNMKKNISATQTPRYVVSTRILNILITKCIIIKKIQFLA